MKEKEVFEAPYRGYLPIGNTKTGILDISCAVLENGVRVISQVGLFKAFKRPPRGAANKEGQENFIISSRNLQDYVTDELLEALIPVFYLHSNGTTCAGYPARLLPLMCQLYIETNKKGKILGSQKKFLEQANTIWNTIGNKDIDALIDEETGFMYAQELDLLDNSLVPYINKNLLKWQRRFPRDFFQEVFRLHQWPFPFSEELKKAETLALAKFLHDYVYFQLPPATAEMLKKNEPPPKRKRPKKKRSDVVHEIPNLFLNRHLVRLVTVLELSDNMTEFKTNFDRVFKKIYQMKLNF